MAHGKHPLDVFRSTSSGFKSASQRRTMPGRVISRSARPGRGDDLAPEPDGTDTPAVAEAPASPKPATVPKIPRIPKATKVPKVRKPGQTLADGTPTAPRRGVKPLLRPRSGNVLSRVSQAVFPVAVLGMAALAVWVVLRTDWLGNQDPALKSADPATVLEPGPGGEAPAATDAWFTIRVGTYNASDLGRSAAWAARDELAARGLPVFDPLGLEEVGADGQLALTEVHLLVGEARSRDELSGLLTEIQGIADWPTGDPRPFRQASIVNHPAPPQR